MFYLLTHRLNDPKPKKKDRIKKLVPEKDLDRDFNQDFLKHFNIYNEIKEIRCECKKCEMTLEDKLQYNRLLKKLNNSMTNLFENEILYLKFKNCQLVNELIIKSFEIVLQADKELKLRKESFCLLVNLIDFTNNENNQTWYKQLLEELFITIQDQLNELLVEKFNLDQVIKLIGQLLKFVKFKDLSLQLISGYTTFLRTNINDSNVKVFINSASSVLEKINKEIGSNGAEPVTLRIKYYSMIGFFKEFIVFIMKDYIQELVMSKSEIIQEFLNCILLINMYHPSDIGGVFYQIYDLYLIFVGDLIGNLSNLCLEEVHFCSRLTEKFIDVFFKNSSTFLSRHDTLFELMVQIIFKSPDLDLFHSVDNKFIQMAFDVITKMIKNKTVGFQFFYQKYWKLIKDHFFKIIYHEKGYMAFELIPCLIKNLHLDHPNDLDLALGLMDCLHNYLKLKVKQSCPDVNVEFTFALVQVVYISPIFYCTQTKQKVIDIVKLYFNIGKKLNFYEWNKFFDTFNLELIQSNIIHISLMDDLMVPFFDLSIEKLSLTEIKKMEEMNPNFDWSMMATNLIVFTYFVVKRFLNRFSDDLKLQVVEFLDYVSKKATRVLSKECAQNTINILML